MKSKTLNISDQLYAKFLDGYTDPVETQKVLDYLNENDAHLNEFLNIRAATQTEAKYKMEFNKTERLNIVKQQLASSKLKMLKRKNFYYAITSLTSVAVITGLVFVFTSLLNPSAQHQVDLFENVETVQNTPPSNDALALPFNNDRDAVANDFKNNCNDVEQIMKSDSKKENIEYQAPTPVQNTTLSLALNHFEMVKPGKTKWSELCSYEALESTFDFQWDTDAVKVEVTLIDKHGNELLCKEVSKTGFSIQYGDYFQYEEIQWRIKASFKDGATDEKHGTLKIVISD